MTALVPRGVIAGIGSTAFGRSRCTLRELAGQAGRAAIVDAGLEPDAIDSVVVGAFAPGAFVAQEHLGPLVAEACGVRAASAIRVEGACASGGLALVTAFTQVAAGVASAVLVVGVEKMTAQPTPKATRILMSAGDQEVEGTFALPFPAAFAMAAREHMHRYGTALAHLDEVAWKAHRNGAQNPKAQFRRDVTRDEIASSRMVADPLRVFHCAPITDGASAVVITRESRSRAVRVLATCVATDSLSFVKRRTLTSFAASREAAAEAYEAARLVPGDVDIAEVHDCFSIAEIAATEDLGFFEAGRGGFAAQEGATDVGGTVVVNASGGLKAKGHPIGATGVGQIVELVERLHGGDRRLPAPDIGLAHNMGGAGSTAVVTLLAAS